MLTNKYKCTRWVVWVGLGHGGPRPEYQFSRVVTAHVEVAEDESGARSDDRGSNDSLVYTHDAEKHCNNVQRVRGKVEAWTWKPCTHYITGGTASVKSYIALIWVECTDQVDHPSIVVRQKIFRTL